jgi:23S rRNA pseudouridine2457 synthase
MPVLLSHVTPDIEFQSTRLMVRSLLSFSPVVPLILLNKPFRVLCQFRDNDGRATLADYIDIAGVYPAGRLDFDSEGLLLLTDDGRLQAKISEPRAKLPKHYWVQVEGEANDEHLQALLAGVKLKDGSARAEQVSIITEPESLWPRDPPIRERKSIPTSWLDLVLSEGRNRQVRRMTAAVDLPALRLIRHRIGPWSLDELRPGDSVQVDTSAAWKQLPV